MVKTALLVIGVQLAVWLTVVGTVIYVVVHFLHKIW